MAGVDGLIRAYTQVLRLPWDPGLAGPQKVWFALYNPVDERRLRYRLPAFGSATIDAGHGWHHLDLTDLFPLWMAAHDYRESYFEAPEDMGMVVEEDFAAHVSDSARAALTAPGVDARTVVAFSGIASLYGLTRFSRVLEKIQTSIQGRLLVFFPGEHDGPNYRLLGARDGWNYHAAPITAQEAL